MQHPVRATSLLSLVFLSGLLSCTPASKEKEAPVFRVIGEAYAGPNDAKDRGILLLAGRSAGEEAR